VTAELREVRREHVPTLRTFSISQSSSWSWRWGRCAQTLGRYSPSEQPRRLLQQRFWLSWCLVCTPSDSARAELTTVSC